MRAEHIGVEYQARGLHILHLDRRSDADTCVVDQHIQRPAIDPLGFLYRSIDLFEICHIEGEDVEIKALGLGQRRQFVRFGPGQSAHGRKHSGPLPRQQFCRQPAKAGRAAGDKNTFACEAEVWPEDRVGRLRPLGSKCGGGSGSGKQGAAIETHGTYPWLNWFIPAYWLCANLQAWRGW